MTCAERCAEAGEKLLSGASIRADYPPVDEAFYPHEVVQIVEGQVDITTVTESIEYHVDMPADRFAIPPAVEALLKEK